MHGNVQYKVEHIFVLFYAGYGINVTGVNSREIIILFSMCRHAHSCAFISVIELPRIPAYYPKNLMISAAASSCPLSFGCSPSGVSSSLV